MSHILNFWQTEMKTLVDLRADCCGCGSCENACPKHAVTMQYDDEGFLYPKVTESLCMDCGICVHVCLMQDDRIPSSDYLNFLAGYTNDQEVLMRTTSGGFATQLALDYVRRGGAVAGVRYSENLIHTEYAIARTEEEVIAFSGSKYTQSEKNDIFRQVEALLKDGISVLFTGCPCDVHGLHRFLGCSYDNLCTVELVCMGVSSHFLVRDYIAWAEKKHGSKLTTLNQRSKRQGWFVPHLEENYANGKTVCRTLYGTDLGYGMQVYNRSACFSCRFRGTSGSGDLRLGDFWGIRDTDPWWNPQGVSCILVRTEKGAREVDRLRAQGFCLFSVDRGAVLAGNQSANVNKDRRYVCLREKFAQVYQRRGLAAACRATGSISFWARRFLPQSWHAFVKKTYHILLERSHENPSTSQ